MTDIDDKSLLRCTIKKSADVLKKVVLYGSYIIAAIAIVYFGVAIVYFGVAIVYFGVTKIWELLINAILKCVQVIIIQ